MEQTYTDTHELQIYTYLRSNYIPADDEGVRVLDDIAFLERELAHINCQDREKKKNALDIRRSLIAPIRRLPIELLLKIFSFLPPERPPSDRDLSYSLPSRPSGTQEMPWVLSHVSSFWRATSLASPSLWTHIYVASKYVKSEQFLVQAALSRSQNCSLDLCLQMDLDGADREEIALEILKRAAPRCKSLRLDIPASTLMGLPCSFPLLQQLELHVEPHSYNLTTSVKMFMQSPQLQSVHFMEVRVPGEIQLPFTELHELSQVFIDSYDQLAAILKGAKDLMSLEAWPSGAYSSMSPIGSVAEKITHNKLAYFDTGFSALEHLTLPALEGLTVDEDDHQDGNEIRMEERMRVLPDFLERSKCRLRRLGLGYHDRVAKILPLIFGSPSLIALTHLEIYAVSATVYGLIGDTRLMPQLSDLSIRDEFELESGETSFFGVAAEAFDAMIEARKDRLKRLTLTSLEVERMSPTLMERIKQIEDDGIEVTFLGPGLCLLYPPKMSN
ncbi:uncharacterized protein EV420DRAFT_94784 [Desarmillaria tabescens]|uniref:F-box domain-containing protein n=1 Tax=Armillaria tabescens TaxID=1929756 RepID=A0AA39NQV0_ARMTA|nr:uncharacterized protein EV420DRAFT_94784 [Desarmillaria tabescens]KAK0470177.1 hypothetical protein EV420DRAFT_94784 [Desarmillaria tabescens]